MTDTATDQINNILPDLVKMIREVICVGYGQVVIQVVDKKIDVIEKKESVKVRKN